MNKENFDSEKENRKNLTKEIKELVITRIEATMPSRLKLCMGGEDGLTKKEMIEHINKEDDTGELIVEAHLNFIKAQANGQLITALNSV